MSHAIGINGQRHPRAIVDTAHSDPDQAQALGLGVHTRVHKSLMRILCKADHFRHTSRTMCDFTGAHKDMVTTDDCFHCISVTEASFWYWSMNRDFIENVSHSLSSTFWPLFPVVDRNGLL